MTYGKRESLFFPMFCVYLVYLALVWRVMYDREYIQFAFLDLMLWTAAYVLFVPIILKMFRR